MTRERVLRWGTAALAIAIGASWLVSDAEAGRRGRNRDCGYGWSGYYNACGYNACGWSGGWTSHYGSTCGWIPGGCVTASDGFFPSGAYTTAFGGYHSSRSCCAPSVSHESTPQATFAPENRGDQRFAPPPPPPGAREGQSHGHQGNAPAPPPAPQGPTS